jgi:adenosylhomocysteine nucleosidase
MYKVGIIAALEREVRPLVRTWRICEKEQGGRRFRFFEKDDAVLVCGGIGAEAARRAAEAMIALYSPAAIYSTGFAGALDPKLKVGDILLPRRLVDAGDGSCVEMEIGGGVLVSFGAVAGKAQKEKLREAFSAHAVDMEAGAVARAAQLRGVRFAVVKVISDEFDFDLPETERFVDANGRFLEARFALFAAIRPWLWVRVLRLAANSGRAARALSEWLEKNMVRMAGTVDGSQTRPLEAVNRR